MSHVLIELNAQSSTPSPVKASLTSTAFLGAPSLQHNASGAPESDGQIDLDSARTVNTSHEKVIIITAVTLVTGTASMLNGIVTVGLPTLAVDLDLGPDLLFWYYCSHDLARHFHTENFIGLRRYKH